MASSVGVDYCWRPNIGGSFRSLSDKLLLAPPLSGCNSYKYSVHKAVRTNTSAVFGHPQTAFELFKKRLQKFLHDRESDRLCSVLFVKATTMAIRYPQSCQIKLFMITLVTLLHVLNIILPANAEVKGTLTTQFGSKCFWREKKPSSGSLVRRIRLDCTCKDSKNNDVNYQCYYVSNIGDCCTKLSSKASGDHYHKYAVAYYAQAVDWIKGKLV